MAERSARSVVASRSRSFALAFVASILPSISATTVIRADLGGGRTFTVRSAVHAIETPPLLPPASAPPLLLVPAGDGCARVGRERVPDRPFALFTVRSGCTFAAKMRIAVEAGAAVLIVADTLAAQYEPPTGGGGSLNLRDPCAVSCDAGRGLVDASSLDVPTVLAGLEGRCPTTAANRLGCSTGLCAFATRQAANASHGSSEREVCCMLDTPPIQMSFANSTTDGTALPALYVPLGLGQRLERECGAPPGVPSASRLCEVRVSEEPASARWDLSALLIWMLGVGTAALAAHIAGSEHYGQDREAARGVGLAPAEIEQATLDSSTALCFPAIASCFLLILFFLLRAGFNIVLLLLNLLFVGAASTASCQTIVLPLLTAACPSLRRSTVRLPFLARCHAGPKAAAEPLPLLEVLAAALSFTLALCWFANRTGPWVWLLQDLLSGCVCVLFVRTLRLPSLRVAALFLGLMFAYDIFMVFISPMIFHTSVMVAVATAGHATAKVSPAGVCVRTVGEAFPMLMAVPHLSSFGDPLATAYAPPLPSPPPSPPLPSGLPATDSWLWRLSGASGSFAMLGLGDIVLPALALAFARRWDLGYPSGGGGYYGWSVGGYALGLAVTLAANTYGWTFNNVQGQPALLYLVPGVLGAILLRSLLHSETSALLAGKPPADLAPPDEEASAHAAAEDVTHSPLLQLQRRSPRAHPVT